MSPRVRCIKEVRKATESLRIIAYNVYQTIDGRIILCYQGGKKDNQLMFPK